MGVYISSPGNSGDAVPVYNSTLSASSGVTIAVPSGLGYMVARIRGTGGMTSGFPTGVLARFNNDSGSNYEWMYSDVTRAVAVPTYGTDVLAATGETTPQLTSMLLANTGATPATDLSITAEFDVAVVTGAHRGYRSAMTSRGGAASTSFKGHYDGWWADTTSVVTSLVLIFGSAFTGTVKVTGYIA